MRGHCPSSESFFVSSPPADLGAGVRLHGAAVPGLPSIVLEAGGGATGAWWHRVQAVLARQTAVLAYDRAGLGARRGEWPESVDGRAHGQRLQALLTPLATAGLPPPYLLVGHSLGGLYAQAVAAQEVLPVCGLVLVDHTQPPGVHGPARVLWRAAFAGLRVVATVWHGGQRVSRGLRPPGGPGSGLHGPWARGWAARVRGLAGGLPPAAQAEVAQALADPQHLAAALREIGAVPQRLAEAAAAALPAGLPLLVVCAGRRGAGAAPRPRSATQRARREALDRLSLPPHHRLCLAQASHASLLTDPLQAQALADAILDFARSLALQAAPADPTPCTP